MKTTHFFALFRQVRQMAKLFASIEKTIDAEH
jgi:hypothetical protein